jgi:hypothetical protein
MKIRVLRWCVLAAAFGVVMLTPRNVMSCGPFFNQAIFTDSRRPASLERFAAGELGVVQPTYPRSMLFAAYRALEGKPLTKPEQEHTLALWRHRLPALGEPERDQASKQWLDARARVPGVEPINEINPSLVAKNYASFLNCTDDAFFNAANTLEQRIQKFGADNPQIAAWVRAQDEVFSNCDYQRAAIPTPAPATFDPLMRADREYQIAAANFYNRNWNAAIDGFQNIASDKASPWHGIAPYLAARALVRQSTLSRDEGFDPEPMQKAETAIKAILADKSQAAMHPAATRLLSFVQFRLHPKERLAELAHALQTGTSTDLLQDLDDYTLLLDQLGQQEDTYQPDERQRALASKRKATAGASADITDWVLTFQLQDETSRQHAIERWQQTHSEAWLVAAISKFDAAEPESKPLITAALQLKPSSPAYVTAMYHALRILAPTRPEEARTRLDSLLANARPHLNNASLNLFYALRMLVARNLDEFITYAQRKPSAIDDGAGDLLPPANPPNDPRTRIAFDRDATRIFNTTMPLKELAAAVRVKTLAPHLRKDLALATWVKAALLDRPEVANGVASEVAAAEPQLKSDLDSYRVAQTNEARRFAGVVTVLRFPGLRPLTQPGLGRIEGIKQIDDYRDNWWCDPRSDRDYGVWNDRLSVLPFGPAQKQAATPETQSSGGQTVKDSGPAPLFLSAAERKQALAENDTLAKLGTAPNLLASESIRWAKAHPKDARVPEALHLAVRATRYGCSDASTPALSKQAFELLHRHYPNSEWTKKTKYYY